MSISRAEPGFSSQGITAAQSETHSEVWVASPMLPWGDEGFLSLFGILKVLGTPGRSLPDQGMLDPDQGLGRKVRCPVPLNVSESTGWRGQVPRKPLVDGAGRRGNKGFTASSPVRLSFHCLSPLPSARATDVLSAAVVSRYV